MEIEDSISHIWLPCPQAIWGVIRSYRFHSETTKLIGGIWLELGFGSYLSGLCITGVVAVGLQMAIKLNQVKKSASQHNRTHIHSYIIINNKKSIFKNQIDL